jgi:iron-sulfur cluster assembly protein
MAIDDSVEEEDFVFTVHGVKVVVDPLSFNYIKGASVDYVEDMMGGGFKIDNPNAVRSCGCGSSFSTEDAPESSGGGGCGSGCGCH